MKQTIKVVTSGKSNLEIAKELLKLLKITGVVDIRDKDTLDETGKVIEKGKVVLKDAPIQVVTMDLKNYGVAYKTYNPFTKKISYVPKKAVTEGGIDLSSIKNLTIELNIPEDKEITDTQNKQ